MGGHDWGAIVERFADLNGRKFVIGLLGVLAMAVGACGDTGGQGDADPTTTMSASHESAGGGGPSDPSEAAMPDVVGLQEGDAIELLASEGISDYKIEELSSLDPQGEVLKQLPSPGSSIRGQVILTVAIALPAMPDYVGMRVGDARAELEGWGVTVSEEKVLNNDRPSGEVIASTPSAGEEVGTEVVLQVAVAPVIGIFDTDVAEVERGTDSSFDVEEGSVEIDGELYESSIYAEGPSYTLPGDLAYWEYNLGRDWESFEAVVGLLDNSSFEQRGRFRIILDGSEIWKKDLEFGQAEEVSINVSDGLRLRLEVVSLEEGAIGLGWGSARLLGIPGEAPVGGQSTDDD